MPEAEPLKAFLIPLSLFAIAQIPTVPSQPNPGSYKGTRYHDTRYQGGAQRIPGKIMCAYYDLGGEGTAYHDADGKNNGSGALNPVNGTYLHEFMIGAGV